MKLPTRLFIIAFIIIAFVGFMVTYTVRFTEKAVVTTFGRADEKSVKEAGLRFKIPYIQQVTKYDTRARYLETNQETQQTADDSQILVTSYMTWRVSDPLKFFKKFASGESEREHYRAAENTLKTKLRSAMGEVSRFTFGELMSADEKASKLDVLENNILQNVRQTAGTEGSLDQLGIEVTSVGISRIGLPLNTTRKVFDRMNAERKRIADLAIQQGQAEAATLTASADADAKKIESFADRLARDIRKQGDIEAAEWLKQMQANPQLAVFIKNMEMFRAFNGSRTTLVLPTSMPGLELLRPDALKNLKAGQIPAMDTSGFLKAGADETAPAAGKPVSAAPAQNGGGR